MAEVVPTASSSAAPIDLHLLPAQQPSVSAPAVPVGVLAPTSIELADLAVVHSDAPARPIIGGTLLVSEELHRVVAVDPDRDQLSVARSRQRHAGCLEGEVVAIDASSLEVVWRATLPSDLRDVVVSGGRYWVSRLKTAELVPVDPDDASVDAPLLPETILPPEGSQQNPDGSIPSSPGTHEPRVLRRLLTDAEGNIVLHHQRANRARLIAAHYGRDVSGSGAIAHGALTLFAPGTQTFSAFGALPNAQIYDMAFSVDGARTAIATGLDRSYLYETLLSTRTGLAATAVGDWTMAEMEGQASAVAYDAPRRLLVQSREPALLHIVGGLSIALSDDSRFDPGHIIFHASTVLRAVEGAKMKE